MNVENQGKRKILVMLTVIAVLMATGVALAFSQQELLDLHSFRQTQTALTSYWFLKDGFKFAYETPVVGYPWSIPFEFPVYQFLVTVICKIFPLEINQVGRIVSFIFLLLCLLPVRSIIRKLSLPQTVFYCFTCLFLSSPLYLYWGRTFMIETIALFFTLYTVLTFLKCLEASSTNKHYLVFSLVASLGMLQKATTCAPVLLLLGIIWFCKFRPSIEFKNLKVYLRIGVCFLIPLVVGIGWTAYTDSLKELNPFGHFLTSRALSKWNWGTLEQRLNLDYLKIIFWDRSFKLNLAGYLGVTVLGFYFIGNFSRKSLVLLGMLFFILPIFLFFNLHRVHDYYQVSCLIFLFFSFSIIVTELLHCRKFKYMGFLLLIIFMVSGYLNLKREYLPILKTKFTASNSRELAIGQYLSKAVPDSEGIVVFGNDWSSSLAYLSKRKSFSVQNSFPEIDEVYSNPDKYMGSVHVSGVVLCPGHTVNLPSTTHYRNWCHNRIHYCEVFTEKCP